MTSGYHIRCYSTNSKILTFTTSGGKTVYNPADAFDFEGKKYICRDKYCVSPFLYCSFFSSSLFFL